MVRLEEKRDEEKSVHVFRLPVDLPEFISAFIGSLKLCFDGGMEGNPKTYAPARAGRDEHREEFVSWVKNC